MGIFVGGERQIIAHTHIRSDGFGRYQTTSQHFTPIVPPHTRPGPTLDHELVLLLGGWLGLSEMGFPPVGLRGIARSLPTKSSQTLCDTV